MLKNIKIIYPSPEGDVVEIFTLGRAIDNALTYDEVQAAEDFQIKQSSAEKDFIKQLLGNKLST